MVAWNVARKSGRYEKTGAGTFATCGRYVRAARLIQLSDCSLGLDGMVYFAIENKMGIVSIFIPISMNFFSAPGSC